MVDTESIRSKIEREARSRWWRRRAPRLIGGALAVSERGDPAARERLVRFVEEYVGAVPGILDTAVEAAKQAGCGDELQPLLELAAGYWDWEEDLIPDRLGLLGLVDDSYLTLRLLERFAAEWRERTGHSLWQARLDLPNRQMAALLGTELAGRLDREVAATLKRSELQAALDALGGWRGELQVQDAPEAAAALPQEPVLERAVGAGTKEFSRREVIWGNVSLLALILGVGIFTVWQIYFRYPMDTAVSILGWDGIELAWFDRLRTFLLGSLGLSVLFAEGNLKSLLSHLFWPFKHIKAPQLKRFVAAPATAVLSIVVLSAFGWVSFTNASVRLVPEPEGSDYMELVVDLFRPRGAFFYTSSDDEEGADTGPWRRVRLEVDGPPLRLALPGLDASAVLVVRDKYSLITVEAFAVERSLLGVRVTPLTLSVPPPADLDAGEQESYVAPEAIAGRAAFERSGRWRVTLSGARWNRPIFQLVQDELGGVWGARQERARLALEPADGRRCPAPSTELELAADLWEKLCDERENVAEWTELSTLRRSGGTSVFHSLPGYQIEVRYATGHLEAPSGDLEPLETREAYRLFAVQRPRGGTSTGPRGGTAVN